jgi:hypothetical protein
MPKTKTVKTLPKANPDNKLMPNEQDTLLEFEQFVTQKPASYNRNRTWLPVFLIIIIVILAGAILLVSKTTQLQKETKYKAVVFDNGLVYYGKIVKEDALNIYMSDIYYIQEEQRTIPAVDSKSQPTTETVPVLIQRGQELHQPVGWSQINRDRVFAIEEIGPTSPILTEIQNLKNQTATK